jgi:hypothetical protein
MKMSRKHTSIMGRIGLLMIAIFGDREWKSTFPSAEVTKHK